MSKKKTAPYSFIPDATYELVVYIFSGAVFATLVTLVFFNPVALFAFFVSLGTFEKFLLLFLFGVGLYSYGQIASVFAAHVVKKPARFLVKRLRRKRLEDFDFDYPVLLADFRIFTRYPKKLKGNYWTLLYYLTVHYPDVADDLWERYARLKLARLNCFNACVLLLALVIVVIIELIHPLNLPASILRPWSLKFCICFLFLGASLVEYAQRQCWFGDILVKACAAIAESKSKNRT